MDLNTIGDFIAGVGFPAFVAIFVLMRLEPPLRRLEKAIMSLTVVTARSNGMKGKEVAEIIKAVAHETNRGRRIEDKVDGVASQDEK